MTREVNVRSIADAIAALCVSANVNVNPDVMGALKSAIQAEPHVPARETLELLLKNAHVARAEQMPICQDTGMAIVFLEIGQDVHLVGGDLETAVNEGVRRGYALGLLRNSVVADPLTRKNSGDNTPAVIHMRLVSGDRVKITVAPKGFGSENMSRVKMLNPSEGAEGVKAFVVDTVKRAGANPCPPIIVGVGIGGSFEKAALLAKEALTLPINEANQDPFYAAMESELLALINETGIGAGGFGGKITALGVRVLTYATHIAGLPVAVNIGCHVTRHAEIVL